MLLHPNVSGEDGSVCGDIMSAVFGPTKNVTHLAQAIVDFLATPNLGKHPRCLCERVAGIVFRVS